MKNHLEVAKLLLSRKTNIINLMDKESVTGFIYACGNKNFELIKIIYDINPNIIDEMNYLEVPG